MFYYLYQHTKKTDGSVFYVGIGSWDRAYQKSSRSKFWHSVVERHGFDVDVVRSFDNWEEACDWERLFIYIYGRRDLGTGCLVNLTDGGDGISNMHPDTKEKIRSKILSKIGRSYDVYRISDRKFIGTFNGTRDAAKEIGTHQQTVALVANHTLSSTKGYHICYSGCLPLWNVIESRTGSAGKSRAGKISIEGQKDRNEKPVGKFSIDGEMLEKFDSATKASYSIGMSRNRIRNVIANNDNPYKGFIWKYL